MHLSLLAALAAAVLPQAVLAVRAPAYDGFRLLWEEDFAGAAGSAPNASRWRVITGDLGVNGELETYTDAPSNVQLSGGQTLQLVPRRSASSTAGWTSGRVESEDSFAPAAGAVTRVEGSLRTGGGGDDPGASQQGIWPAFWMLGESMRAGTSWPLCGELDILEQVNGAPTGYGTAHCGSLCRDPTGWGGRTAIAEGGSGSSGTAGLYAAAGTNTTALPGFHTWSVTWDLTSSDWPSQRIVWALDGQPYFALAGQDLADQPTWSVLAHSPFYLILNVAVGGSFPGAPSPATRDGYDSMMEVLYVAVYTTAQAA